MGENRSLGEVIVEMICNGRTTKQIEDELGISKYELEDRFKRMRANAWLPYEKRTYKARKQDIMDNIAKWKKYEEEKKALQEKYIKSLAHFDF